MSALSKIESAGFNVSLVGVNLAISPASNLTQTQKEFLRSHKAEIIQELKAVVLSEADRKKILLYLESIGETNQALIDNLLERCARDREALAWVIGWADKVRVKMPSPPVLVTCRNCTHFKCYNAHGGGAGRCSIGARSAGHCQWSDDQHQCDHYSISTLKTNKTTK